MAHLTNTTIPQGFSLFQSDLDEVLDLLSLEWEPLAKTNLFLTGGTGFFGIWIIESILWANQNKNCQINLTVLTRSKIDFLEKKAPHLKDQPNLHFIEGSASNFVIPKATSGKTFDYIIHAASENNIAASPLWPEKHYREAIEGTQRLIEMAKSHQSKAILITSSGAVYLPIDAADEEGRGVEGPHGLNDFSSEKIVYGQSKRMMEVITAVAAKTSHFDALIARCFAFLGPYLPIDSNYAAGNFVRDALLQKEIIVSGDGTPLRSYMYPVDLVVWLLKILVSGKSGIPYNVGGEQMVSIGQLAKLVSEVGQNAAGYEVRGVPKPNAKPSVYVPSLERVQSELNVKVTVDLEETIYRTLKWHQVRRK
jgi:dTDP-glucose 4,6-dehydratase